MLDLKGYCPQRLKTLRWREPGEREHKMAGTGVDDQVVCWDLIGPAGTVRLNPWEPRSLCYA
jgi:hypothetical protein